jgi:hypothetical protein
MSAGILWSVTFVLLGAAPAAGDSTVRQVR